MDFSISTFSGAFGTGAAAADPAPLTDNEG
jgi:hypothetical protein